MYAPACNTVQLYFDRPAADKTRDAIVGRRGEPLPAPAPLAVLAKYIRERAAWIMKRNQPVPNRTLDIRWAVRIVTVVLAALAIYGGYVRYVVAKGH